MLLPEAKKTLKLAFPIILGEVAQMMLGIIDTAMVGAVGYKQLAAAALVMSVINIPLCFRNWHYHFSFTNGFDGTWAEGWKISKSLFIQWFLALRYFGGDYFPWLLS